MLCFFKQVTHTGSAHTDEHFHEIRSGDAEKRYSGFACHGFRQQGLTGSGRALQQDTLGDSCSDTGVFSRLLQEINDLLQFFLFLFQTGYLSECDTLVTQCHLGAAFAEVHHLAVTAACLLGIHHHEQENSHRQHDQHRQHIGQEPVLPFNVIDHRIKPILTYQGLQFCNVRCVQLMRYTVLHLDLQISGRCFSVGLHHDFRYIAGIQIRNELCLGVFICTVVQQVEAEDHQKQKYDKYKI